MIEVERKYRLPSPEALSFVQARVKDLGDGVRQVDAVYLQDVASFSDVDHARGYAVLRVRESGNHTVVTAKRRRTGDSAIEAEFETTSENASAFMEALRWNEVVRVAKVRRVGTLGSVTVAVDEVEGLGYFVELEVVVSDERATEAALRSIELAAGALDLNDDWIEARKYDELSEIARHEARRSGGVEHEQL